MKKINFLLIAAALFMAAACDNNNDLLIGETDISAVTNSTLSVLGVPFADEQTLAEIAANPANVPYTTARKLATVEMELGVKQTMQWNGTKLSEKPVVIFDGKSNAKYYEFIVVNGTGDPVGTVTLFAQKEADEVMAYVLPFVRNYSALTTKGSGYKLINGGYPTKILLGIPGKSGEDPSAVIEPETGRTFDEVPSDDVQGFTERLASLSIEELEAFGISDVSAVVAEAQQKDAQRNADAEEFWVIIDSLTSAIEATSDDAIVAAVNSSKSEWTSYDTYRIPAFYTAGMYYTRWNGWCGPSALAWIYRGLYSSYYNDTFLPLYNSSGFSNPGRRELLNSRGRYDFNDAGDADGDGIQNDLDKDWVDAQSINADGGLYARIADLSGLYSWRWAAPRDGLTLPSGLSTALSNVTNGTYGLSGTYLSAGHNHIRNNALPTLLVVDGLSHYVVAFGSEYRYWNWDVYVKIFGKKITISSGKTRTGTWALINDNGYMTEKYGFAPYWRSEVLGLDISYLVIRK
jgi:hypothetical protein